MVDTIDGALPATAVTQKIDAALAGTDKAIQNIKLDPVSRLSDFTIGNPQAKVTLVLYEDFQCPFCGRFFSETEKTVIDSYIKAGKINFVYRDFPFL